MTTQQKLPNVWAEDNSGVEEVNAAKYTTGWVAEIPTYQHFNYVLQTTTKNILAHAEGNVFDWEADINYTPGAKVRHSGNTYYAIIASYNEDPTADWTGLRNHWAKAPVYGDLPNSNDAKRGMHLDKVDPTPATVWDGNSETITAESPRIALNTTGTSDNHVIGNTDGFLTTMNVGDLSVPDNRSIVGSMPAGQGVYKIYHEGFKPTVDDVTDGIGEPLKTGLVYGRQWNSGQASYQWEVTSGTIVGPDMPADVTGSGQGWYNTGDGVHYTDIDDGDSSQYVPSSPAMVPEAASITYDNTNTTLVATTMQAAIDELAILAGAV